MIPLMELMFISMILFRFKSKQNMQSIFKDILSWATEPVLDFRLLSIESFFSQNLLRGKNKQNRE